MERRNSRRITVNLNAELISGSINQLGFIENISEEGLYLKTAPTRTKIDYTPGRILELKFRLPSKETLNLNCKVIWAYRSPHNGLTSSMGIDPPPEYTEMGIQIIDPPPRYIEFVNTL